MPLPRFVQRLFQNDGYGPKLRSEIIPWDDEKRFTALEAWRQAMIGTPMPMAGTTPPPGFMWADGSFASFAVYPELKARYDAGGFTGMLLAYNASEEDIAAYPGKFKPDAAKPTGLFVPRLNGLFARYCGETEAGKLNKPGLPNAEGLLVGYGDRTAFSMDVTNGVFEALFDPLHPHVGPAEFDDRFPAAWRVKFSLAKGNAIYGASDTVMPSSSNLPIALYLGRPAQV